MPTKAIYPGTFDPITMGHVDVVERASRIFDEVIVAVARPRHKQALFTFEERIYLARESLRHLKNVSVMGFDGLMVEFAKSQGVKVVIRGIRAVSDFDYEFKIAWMNRKLCPQLETIFLMPSEEYSFLASSLVKEVALLGGDVSGMVPDVVKRALEEKINNGR